MCGIAGLLRFGGPDESVPTEAAAANRSLVEAMTAAIAHRGPDGQGVFAEGPVALGHRRLAIIDVDGSRQPMTSVSGRSVVVYNGEIYNYRALRRELLAEGVALATRGDTEVILALYEAHGVAGLERLRGMFAFALWDRAAQRLLLARDPIGIKPLYFQAEPQRLAFASELKALPRDAASGAISLDPAAVNTYFLRQYAGGEQTCLQGAEKVPAGTVLEIDATGRTRAQRPWDVPARAAAHSSRDTREWLDQELSRAVHDHLESDVPVGVFLSGGIDSSLLVAFARRHSQTTLSTFSVGFGDAAVDEVGFARRVARAFETDHHEIRVTAEEALAELPHIVRSLDQPFADYAIVPTHAVSRAARRHVKVVLSGEGADEVFGGYVRRYLPFVLSERFGIDRLRLPLPSLRAPLFGDAARRKLLGDRFVAASALPYEALLRGEIETHRGHGAINAALHADARGWLQSDLLTKVDEMGMLASLEARVPYLDLDLVRQVAALPGSRKIGLGGTKRILREVASELLPAEIVRRRKHGFTVPVAAWLRGPLRERFEDIALAPGAADGWLDRDEVLAWWRRLLGGQRVGLKVWSIFIFAWWVAEHRAASPAAARS